MVERLVKKRMTKMALFVSMFAFLAVAGDARSAEASCGDYLKHSRVGMLSDLTTAPASHPACKGGNCRAAPTTPPVEPTPIVISLKQPPEFRLADADADTSKSRIFELHDDVLPLSSPVEVLTPPPIFAA